MNDGIELGLGTAQFGLAYGVCGRGAVVPEVEIQDIVDRAFAHGIRQLDTAPAYGDVEGRLSQFLGSRPFRITSKIPALPIQAPAAERAALAVNSVRHSLDRLGDRLGTLLFHRGLDLLDVGGQAAWNGVVAETAGTGIRIGASCYSPQEAIAIRAHFKIQVAQIPGNALDQRLLHGCTATELVGVEIQLRSLFLQGLLLMAPTSAAARVPNAATPLAAWAAWRNARGIDALRGALGVAISLPGVRCCIVGVDSAAQLDEIASAWKDARPLSAPVATDDENVIDPRRWTAVS